MEKKGASVQKTLLVDWDSDVNQRTAASDDCYAKAEHYCRNEQTNNDYGEHIGLENMVLQEKSEEFVGGFDRGGFGIH